MGLMQLPGDLNVPAAEYRSLTAVWNVELGLATIHALMLHG